MKKKWFILLLTLVCAIIYSLPRSVEAANTNLTDIKGHWAEKEIRQLVQNGAVSGYPDGTFKPNNEITRAEFVKIIIQMFQLRSNDHKARNTMFYEDTYTEEFTKDPLSEEARDSLQWAVKEINVATILGIVNGTGANKFSPDTALTREQLAIIVYNLIYNATPFTLQELSNTPLYDMMALFKDSSSISVKAAGKINTLVLLGIMQGDNNGNFNPQKTATRAEAVAILSRLLEKASNQDVTVIYSNNQHHAIEEEMPAQIKDWISKEEESHVWYEEDGVYVGARRMGDPCNSLELKGIDKTSVKTTVTFNYTYPEASENICPSRLDNHVIIVKLPNIEKAEVTVLK